MTAVPCNLTRCNHVPLQLEWSHTLPHTDEVPWFYPIAILSCCCHRSEENLHIQLCCCLRGLAPSQASCTWEQNRISSDYGWQWQPPSLSLPNLLTLIILLPLVLLPLGPSFFMFAFQFGNFHPPTFICSYHTGNYCCNPSKRIQTQQNFSVKNNCLSETCAFIRHKLFCSV